MKKTLSINISGIIFHIEEDGYEALRKYLDSINKYFGSFEDSSEILADIESRIAEIFLAKLNEGKQVITAEDVQHLMATMGNINDFKAAEENNFTEESTSKQEPRPSYSSGIANKKLVRDKRRKILGGVCAGLAHYFDIDPVWPRLIFALLSLGYGSGIIVYLILWIALPADENLEEQTTVKKMYRSAENKVLGGVAQGIAAYFGWDVVAIRILFTILIFFGGFGFILYIILWISVPVAKTMKEKMEMQGEPVTLSNIESSVKKSLNEKTEEESTLAKIILFPFRALAAILTFAGKILGPIFKGLTEVVRVMLGLILLLTGIGLVLSILLTFGLIFGVISSSVFPASWGIANVEGINLPLEAIQATFPTPLIVASFLAVLIPAICIQLLGSSIIAKRMVFRPFMGWVMSVVFLLSVLYVVFSLPGIILSFKEEGEYKVEKTFDVTEKTTVFKIKEVGLDDYQQVNLSLNGYDGKPIKLTERFLAQGANHKRASENAQTVSYNVQQADNTITFDSNITFAKGSKFHAQRLELEMLVPYNVPFVMDGSFWRLLDNQVRWDFSETDKPQTWKLTKEKLECLTCPALPKSEQGLSETDQFGFTDFDELDIKGVFNLEIRRGDQYSVEINAPENERSKYKVERIGNTLEINYKVRNRTFWMKNLDGEELARINITLPDLRNLKIKGAGKIRIEGFNEDDMELSLLGAMTCEANIYAQNLQLDLSGPMVFELDGHGDFLEAEVSKVAQLKATGYEVRHAVVTARELGRARVNASERVEIETDVTGSVKFQGSPEVIRHD
ncbi:MAG: PspC domain-containing protein [Bacteroidetes bacterium]|nr:PspC domain-containing protein [Bacteroidota bacterium]